MILPADQAKQVKQGRKTQVRQPVEPGQACRYKPGRTYAIQPSAGKPALCHILITAVDQQPLRDLTYRDARKEGFATQRDFFDHWLEAHGHIVPDLPVWVIAFQLAQDRPRLLTPTARPRGSERGYTTNRHNAMPDEPEALDAATLEHYAKQARETYNLAHAEQVARREARSLANQLREAQARAHRQGVDVTPEMQAIRRQLDQIQTKLRSVA